MKSTFKKNSTLVLAVIMVLVMGTTAFAAGGDMSGQSGVIGEFETKDTPTTYDDTVKIYKEITAYNPEPVTVNAPTVTYNYTIGAATVAAGTTVKDNASRHNQVNSADVNVTVAVKAGVGTPTITGTAAGALAITPTNQLKASKYGTANRFELTVDFSSVNWATTGTGAGVYRYEITETTTIADKNAAGIADGNNAADDKLYMDVYVDGSGNIYGYVLFTNNSSIDGSTSEDTASTDAGKVDGFVDDANEHVYTSSDESTADKYYTFNLEVSKDVQNDAYAVSTAHQFPFDITFANTNVTANVLPKVTKTGTATLTIPSIPAPIANFSFDGTAATPTNNLTIADDAVISFVGIPCGTTVTIKEKNDVVGVTYSAGITNADTNGDAKFISTNEESNNAVVNCGATHLAKATENHTDSAGKVVTFTNTLVQISPTGVALRVAPYVLMLSVGMILVLFSRRRKAEEEA